jgi:hypothetical protein
MKRIREWAKAHLAVTVAVALVFGGIFLAVPLAVWRARLKAKLTATGTATAAGAGGAGI